MKNLFNILLVLFLSAGCTFTHSIDKNGIETKEYWQVDTRLIEDGTEAYIKIINAGCEKVKDIVKPDVEPKEDQAVIDIANPGEEPTYPIEDPTVIEIPTPEDENQNKVHHISENGVGENAYYKPRFRVMMCPGATHYDSCSINGTKLDEGVDPIKVGGKEYKRQLFHTGKKIDLPVHMSCKKGDSETVYTLYDSGKRDSHGFIPGECKIK